MEDTTGAGPMIHEEADEEDVTNLHCDSKKPNFSVTTFHCCANAKFDLFGISKCHLATMTASHVIAEKPDPVGCCWMGRLGAVRAAHYLF